MTYAQPTLFIPLNSLSSRLGATRRDFSDWLKQYRSYQRVVWDYEDQGQTPPQRLLLKVDHARSRLQHLSYRRRALLRGVAVLEAEQVPAPTGMTGPQLIEATDVVRGVMRNAHNIPQDQFAGQIAYQLSRRGFHK